MNDLNILEIRKSLKMTQEEFGELIGTNRRTIINYEKGKKIPSTKVKLLELLVTNGIVSLPKEKLTTKNKIIVGDMKDLRREILDHKDHIKTLKELIEAKDKFIEMYKNENVLLKEKIENLINSQGIKA